MIYDIRFHMNDQGQTVTSRTPRIGTGTTYHFSGQHPFAWKHPTTGEKMGDARPIVFEIPASSVEDAFEKLPAAYKAAADALMEVIKREVETAKQLEFRQLITGVTGNGKA